MKFTGKFLGCSTDYATGSLSITFRMNENKLAQLDEINALECLDITAEKHKERRSLNANSYFHVLVGKIADITKDSKPKTKNLLLGRYGQKELDENGNLIMFSIITDANVLEREDIHLCPQGMTITNGQMYTDYLVIRPSHTYTKDEMQVLISGTVDEAKALGIDTMTPQEIERMMQQWHRNQS